MRNEDLREAMSRYKGVEEIMLGVAGMLGGRSSIPQEDEVEVLAYILRADEAVFRVWTVTPGGFSLFEMSAEGETLTICIPLSRVRRTVLSGREGQLVGTIEIEADRSLLEVGGESLTFPGPEDAQRGGRSILTGSIRPSVYEIAGSTPEERMEVRSFFQGLRLGMEV